jgi:hypothetical protein
VTLIRYENGQDNCHENWHGDQHEFDKNLQLFLMTFSFSNLDLTPTTRVGVRSRLENKKVIKKKVVKFFQTCATFRDGSRAAFHNELGSHLVKKR